MSEFSTWYSMERKGKAYYLSGKRDITIEAYIQRVVGSYDFNVEICTEDEDEMFCITMSLEDFKAVARKILDEANDLFKTKHGVYHRYRAQQLRIQTEEMESNVPTHTGNNF